MRGLVQLSCCQEPALNLHLYIINTFTVLKHCGPVLCVVEGSAAACYFFTSGIYCCTSRDQRPDIHQGGSRGKVRGNVYSAPGDTSASTAGSPGFQFCSANLPKGPLPPILNNELPFDDMLEAIRTATGVSIERFGKEIEVERSERRDEVCLRKRYPRWKILNEKRLK